MSSETTSGRAEPKRSGRIPTAARRALTVAGAAAAALALWALADPVAGIDLTVRRDGAAQQVGPGAVAVASLLAGSAAWALLALLERIMDRSRRTWTAIAIVVLVLSLLGPLGADGIGAVVTLAGMHLIVAAVLVSGLGCARGCGAGHAADDGRQVPGGAARSQA